MGRRCGRREPQRMASSVLAVLALAAAWQATGAQTVPEQDGCLPNISPACLAKLTIDTLGRTTFLTAGLVNNLTAAVLACAGASADASSIRPLRLMMPTEAQGAFQRVIPAVKLLTGWSIEVQFLPFSQIGGALLEQAATLGKGYYDAMGCEDTTWTVDLVQAGMVEQIDAYVFTDKQINYSDFLGVLRSSSALWNGSIVGTPLSSFLNTLYYRRDALALAGVEAPPSTWQELVQVARLLNGTDWDKDGQGEYALCMFTTPSTNSDPSVLLGQVLASMTQTQGTQTGWLFDPGTMGTFVDSPAMAEALDIVRQLLPYNLAFSVPATDLENQVSNPFVHGKCAMQIRFMSTFKSAQLVGKLGGRVGTALLPGSTTVLDRSTGKLVPCTPGLCPYATWVDGVGINRAHYSGYTAGLGMINAFAPSTFKAAAYTMSSLFTQGQAAMSTVMSLGWIGPVRYSHLCVTPPCLASWRNAGYNTTDVAQYLNVTRQIADSGNVAMGLRMQNADKYRDALNDAMAMLLNNGSTADIQLATSRRFAAITGLTPLQELGDAYLAGLNARRRFTPPLQSPPPPAASNGTAATPQGSASSSDGLSRQAEVGVIVGASVGGAVLVGLAATLALVLQRKGRRRQGRAGPVKPPGAGAATTLVVTDIEGSTELWEALPHEAMDRAVDLHNAVARLLLHEHGGHEAYCEGDSFTVVFASPWDALAFAQALQAELLAVEWPEELLQCRAAASVWMQNSGGEAGEGADLWGPMMTTNNDLDADRKQGSLTAPQHSDGDAAAITSESIFAAVDTPRGGGNGAGAQQRQQQRLPPASPQPYAKPHFLALDISSALGVVGGGGNGGGGQAAAPMPVTGDSEVTAVDVAAPLPAGGGGGAAAGFFRGKRALDALPKFLGGRGVPLNPLALLTGGDQAAWATQQQPYEGFLIGAMGHTQSVGAALCKGWAECEAPAEPEGKPGSEEKRLVLRGLRVRVGLHSGLSEEDVVEDKQTNAVKYVGRALSVAKVLCDCGHGGMVLLSEACYGALVPASGLAAFGHMLHLGDFQFLASAPDVPPTALYWCIGTGVQARLPLLLPRPLRRVLQVQAGAPQAPAGHAAVVFVNVVGASVLSAWDAAVAGRAFALLHHHARRLLGLSAPGGSSLPEGETAGYAVKMTEGMCLCAFACPAAAMLWGARLVDGLRLSGEWEPALLADGLCDEVVVDPAEFTRVSHGHSNRTSRSTNRHSSTTPRSQLRQHSSASPWSLDAGRVPSSAALPRRPSGAAAGGDGAASVSSHHVDVDAGNDHVLFRGLRLKVGVDAGPVQATIIQGTGRVDYRGRIVNRAARVAAKAQAGQVWASKVAWDLAHEKDVEGLLEPRPLGPVALKGVAEPVELVQCKLA